MKTDFLLPAHMDASVYSKGMYIEAALQSSFCIVILCEKKLDFEYIFAMVYIHTVVVLLLFQYCCDV